MTLLQVNGEEGQLAGEAGSRSRYVCNDLDICIELDGTWLHRGFPIRRKEIVCLFASCLSRDEEGDYWLTTPAERGRIEVKDAPFLAVEMFTCQSGRDRVITLRTNVDELVTIDEATPLIVRTYTGSGEAVPYVLLENGLRARLSRAVYYDLVALGNEEIVDGEARFGVWSMGHFCVLGTLNGQD